MQTESVVQSKCAKVGENCAPEKAQESMEIATAAAFATPHARTAPSSVHTEGYRFWSAYAAAIAVES